MTVREAGRMSKQQQVPLAESRSRYADWPKYYRFKIKCQNCLLHFVLYRWRNDLSLDGYCCPECHKTLRESGSLPTELDVERRYGFIFEELGI